MSRLGSVPRLVARIGSGVRVSTIFKNSGWVLSYGSKRGAMTLRVCLRVVWPPTRCRIWIEHGIGQFNKSQLQQLSCGPVQCIFSLLASAPGNELAQILFLWFWLLNWPMNVEVLSGCRQVVVVLTAQIQCATGLTDQLVESVCSNFYIVYLRLKMMSSYFSIMRLLVCTYKVDDYIL